jgi:hypothetical protein
MLVYKEDIADDFKVNRRTVSRLLHKVGLQTGKRKSLLIGEFKQLVDYMNSNALIPHAGTNPRMARAYAALAAMQQNSGNASC